MINENLQKEKERLTSELQRGEHLINSTITEVERIRGAITLIDQILSGKFETIEEVKN